MEQILFDKNAPYLLAAYAVFLGGLLLYSLSLRLRRRSLDRDEEVIKQIDEERGR
jgi:hypothetical protein